jgi:hypothetical protein
LTINIAIIGSRGYPCVYSGYETFVAELSERLARQGIGVTVYCHRNLFQSRPKEVNGIRLVYIPTIERKTLSQFIHSFQSMLHACFGGYDAILVVNSANGPFGLLTRLFRKRTAINVDGLEWLRGLCPGHGLQPGNACRWPLRDVFHQNGRQFKNADRGNGATGGTLGRLAAESPATNPGKLYLGKNHRPVSPFV